MKINWTNLRMNLFLVVASMVFSCTGQNTSVPPADDKPDVRISVNKQTDRHGRIIRYDSTYSYTYRSRGGADSLMSTLPWFHKSMWGRSFPWQRDSLFFRDDLFSPLNLNRQFEWHDKMFEQMLRQQAEWKRNLFYEKPRKPGEKVI